MAGISMYYLLLLLNFQTYFCQNLNNFFEEINKNTLKFNEIASEIAWKSSIEPGNPNLLQESAEYQRNRIIWQQDTCEKLATLNRHILNNTQRRMTYLLCRGPIFTFEEAKYLRSLYNELQSTYSDNKICLPSENNISKTNLTDLENTIINYLSSGFDQNRGSSVCLNGEDAFENIMSFSRNEEVLKWVWGKWRDMTRSLKKPFRELVKVENVAARRNGYTDIGQVWRDDLETPNLRALCRRLYHSIRPLYQLIHGVVRFYLRRQYGEVVSGGGLIPAHFLGNLWSQSWDSIIDVITPKSIDLDDSIKNQNWTVFHMVRRAEDFYQSLGLPAMPKMFWRESVFTRETRDTRCHGAAADMFKDGDVRLIYCSGTTMHDFYVLHHEMGHIQYYMAYEDQPGLFRQANTALHESIGDGIMYGVMTPQHLHRLGLINDTILYNIKNINIRQDNDKEDVNQNTEINGNKYKSFNEDEDPEGNNYKTIEFDSTDDIIMLKQALNKIPQIPFSLIVDEYRWKYFEGSIERGAENAAFWNMVEEFSGIAPPSERGEEYFDVAAKFHVPDNTPYIRYFLSSFLQHQLFEVLCKAAVFGRGDVDEDLPHTIKMNRCDIYGSKTAGKLLKDLMSQGHSKPWRQVLSASLGIEDVSAAPLLRYYRPLQELLEKFVAKYDIPIGW